MTYKIDWKQKTEHIIFKYLIHVDSVHRFRSVESRAADQDFVSCKKFQGESP